MYFKLFPIGIVCSPFKTRQEVPRQGEEILPPVKIEIFSKYLTGLRKLAEGQSIYVLTWLHLADRKILEVHPKGDRRLALHGVFATRSPDRPNPIGLHLVTLEQILEGGIIVHPLEAIDGTPVLDIKPYLSREGIY
ncbi:MAG: tRNA (N6-threonylcarbamoyladenosine(37)-N6)-methyltransferase TrmO [Thermovirga sp.]|nr:tRNA (N6-threonylcarbamoyladenosine(37)-N6)-methyltransferase TrmO [Thermovirga sp.]